MNRPRYILFLLALLGPLTSSAWAQTGLLRGTVVDPEQNPIEGVKITVTSDELSSFRKILTTNAKGAFVLRFQQNQAQYLFSFLFEKSGFESFTQPFSPSLMETTKEQYVMEPAETQAVENLGDLSSVLTGAMNTAIEAFNAGLTAQRAADLVTARARFEEALTADPQLGAAQIALAQVLLDQNEYQAALTAAERALELVPGRVDALQVKYQALRALGRGDEADQVAADLEQAEDAVAAARRHYNEGGESFQAGDKQAALSSFRHATELDPSLIEAHHAVATLELGSGNHEASAAAAEKALALGSDDVRTLRVLYEAYGALGRTEELTEIAPRLAAIDPDFGGSKLIEQAAEMWNSGDAAKAVALSRMALAVDSGLAKAYYFIGLDHLSRGENSEARQALERFITLAPEDAEASTAQEMLGYIE